MSWIIENYAAVLEVIGAVSVVAALVAKLTPSKLDDTWVAKVQKVLDVVALNVRK